MTPIFSKHLFVLYYKLNIFGFFSKFSIVSLLSYCSLIPSEEKHENTWPIHIWVHILKISLFLCCVRSYSEKTEEPVCVRYLTGRESLKYTE